MSSVNATDEKNQRIRAWIQESPEHELLEDSLIMWGVWLGEGDDEYHPPEAIFLTEDDANAYASLMTRGCQPASVQPCTVDFRCRDNFEVPK